MTKKSEKKDLPLIKVKCFACGFVNEVTAEEPYQQEIYKRTGHITCKGCGLKFSEGTLGKKEE